MSLPALALRLATVYSLRGATAALDQVLDAPIDPIARAQALSGPVIAVFTSDQSLTPERKSLVKVGRRRIVLRLQVFLPAEVAIRAPGGTLTLDVREEGGATLLDVIYRQIERALTASQSPWRELWAELVTGFDEITVEDLVIPVERGIDLVAREVTIPCWTLPSPEIGRSASVTWPGLVALMRADPDLAPLADWIDAEITQPDSLDGARLYAALAGLSSLETDALGFGPVTEGRG